MCSGLPPFRGTTTLGVMRQVCEETPTPIRSLNPDIPEWLEALIARLLARDPAQRFQSAGEVAALLEGYLAHLREPVNIAAPSFRALPPPSCVTAKPSWAGSLLGGALAAAALLFVARVFLQPVPPPANEKPQFAEIYEDFRGKWPLSPSFYMVGPDLDEVVKSQAGGLRITLPANRGSHQPASVQATLVLSGDFEVTGSFEILSAKQPVGGYGAGVALNVADHDGREKFAGSARVFHPRTGSVFWAQFWTQTPRKEYKSGTVPSEARLGKLRLQRAGPTMRMLFAEGADDEFREIYRVPHFGTEDLAHLRFEVIDSGEPGNPVDARLIDLRIRAARLIVPGGTRDAGAPVDAATGNAASRAWLAAALTVGLAAALLCAAVAGGLWVLRRRAGHRTPEAVATPDRVEKSAEDADAAATRLLLQCPACNRKLKVKPALAGKNVKCPQCGGVIVAPTAPAPSQDRHV
jgi:hypothetical protein